MREQRNNNFWVDVFKYFLIWNLLILLIKVVIFICKAVFIVILQFSYLLIIGIKKLVPIVKNNFNQLKIDYIQNCKSKINIKYLKVKRFFLNILFNLKNKIDYLKAKCNEYSKKRIKKKEERHKKSNLILKVKKTKYWIIDFFYTNELQILIIAILTLALVIVLIIINVTTK